MMSKNLRNVQSGVKRFMSAAAPKSAPSLGSSSNQVKVSTLPSGLVLASIDAEAPLARVAVTIRAGARYEPEVSLGITHTLRSAAGFSTKNFTNFNISRDIEYYGGRLSVIGQRDTITYLLEAHSEEGLISRNFELLADTVSNPEFFHWELSDNLERIKADLSLVEDAPQIQLTEALHKAAFKGGLRKSLYTPKHMVGKHTTDNLLEYVKKRFVSPNTVVVGYGVDHQQLVEMVGKGINLGSSAAGKCNAKYIGGELHIDSSSNLTYVALASEGVGLANSKEALAAALFQSILGADGKSGRLNKSLAIVQSGRFDDNSSTSISAFNINFEETGLFGINLVVPASQDVTGMLKNAVKELKAAASVSDADVATAKKNLQARILISSDNPDNLVTDLSFRLLAQGKGSTPQELCKEVESISAADVKSFANKLTKGRPTLASVGRNAPYLSDIFE